MTKAWEFESTLEPGRPRPSNSPWALIGFLLGLLAMSPGVFLY